MPDEQSRKLDPSQQRIEERRAALQQSVRPARRVSLLRNRPAAARSSTAAFRATLRSAPLPPKPNDYVDRRSRAAQAERERRQADRRHSRKAIPFPDRRLTRSAYEQVFLKLVSGGRLRVNGQTYTPIGMKGWLQAIFRRDSDGAERLFSIDQLLRRIDDWV
jgi:hypothetical protein